MIDLNHADSNPLLFPNLTLTGGSDTALGMWAPITHIQFQGNENYRAGEEDPASIGQTPGEGSRAPALKL